MVIVIINYYFVDISGGKMLSWLSARNKEVRVCKPHTFVGKAVNPVPSILKSRMEGEERTAVCVRSRGLCERQREVREGMVKRWKGNSTNSLWERINSCRLVSWCSVSGTFAI